MSYHHGCRFAGFTTDSNSNLDGIKIRLKNNSNTQTDMKYHWWVFGVEA